MRSGNLSLEVPGGHSGERKYNFSGTNEKVAAEKTLLYRSAASACSA